MAAHSCGSVIMNGNYNQLSDISFGSVDQELFHSSIDNESARDRKTPLAGRSDQGRTMSDTPSQRQQTIHLGDHSPNTQLS